MYCAASTLLFVAALIMAAKLAYAALVLVKLVVLDEVASATACEMSDSRVATDNVLRAEGEDGADEVPSEPTVMPRFCSIITTAVVVMVSTFLVDPVVIVV